ncbi:MAG TPA: hypothetical protein VFH45_07905 [Acidimicrobiales bacterium]|nr:hypothetical protein [Acidimicrobiales bacterium]
MPLRVAIVPHTHWDREWYRPFQAFRLLLVSLVDGLLDRLESDPSYTRFLLDGQMAVVDDYLEVRPENEERIRRLASAGRVSVGPWYILMDEFLVSGETIVRNLQMGIERAAAFGGAMPVGYLPDMFGHIAQMPQILRLAGFEHAVVWRGVPSAVDRTAFWWSAPDGSTVRAEYLVTGYGNGADMPDDAKELVAQVRSYADGVEGFLLGPLLYMNGTDHQVPRAFLGRVVAEANGAQEDIELAVSSLPEYIATAPSEGLPSWQGELRSGARANLLMGVASNRTDVKQAAARTERALERLAEPLAALYAPVQGWPSTLLDLAWREVIRNSAHDSICACSVDEVVDAVLHRFAEARQVAEGLTQSTLAVLAESTASAGPLVVNPTQWDRGGVVELKLPGDGPVEDAQMLEQRSPVLTDVRVTAAQLVPMLADMRTQQLGPSTFVNEVEVSEDDDGLDVVFRADALARVAVSMDEVKADIARRVDGRPDLRVRFRLVQPPRRRVLARVPVVPAYGWAVVDKVTPPAHPVRRLGEAGLDNGLVRVEVDPDSGTFSLDGLAGFDRLVDDGDAGDTYNYSPPQHDLSVDRPESVEVRVEEEGPVRGRLRITRRFRWPERWDRASGSRVGERTAEVDTTVEVHADDRLVRVHHRFENSCRDHRLRALLPLREPAHRSHAECAFAVVTRGLTAEGGPSERGLATFPSRRFVHAGGLTLFHEGLLEYQLTDASGAEPDGTPAAALALTLLRCTGMLSGVDLAYRPLPAGPAIAAGDAQMQGPVEARYALLAGPAPEDGWEPVYAAADDFLLPLIVTGAPGGGSRPDVGSELEVSGAVVSAVRRVAGRLEVRLFNPSDRPTTARLPGRSGWVMDLRGAPVAPFDGSVELSPWEVATLHAT